MIWQFQPLQARGVVRILLKGVEAVNRCVNTAGLAGLLEANRQPATSDKPKFQAIPNREKEYTGLCFLLRFLTRPF
jgi:hypothetical protein